VAAKPTYEALGRRSAVHGLGDAADRAVVGEPRPIAGGDPNFMTSLARGLAIIQAFSHRKRHVTVSQLSAETALSRAAVRRCLYTLSKLGFAGSEDGRHFFLLPRVLTLGHSYMSSMPLVSAAQPVLERLSRLLHESCSLAILDGSDIIYIARAQTTRVISVNLGVGSRLPAFCTSMGRVLLANLPPEELDLRLGVIKFSRLTDRTITTVEKLRHVLGVVRANGYCIVDQELEWGLRSIAVPVKSPDGPTIAALNAGTQAKLVSIQQLQGKFLPQLRGAAQELSMLTGYTQDSPGSSHGLSA